MADNLKDYIQKSRELLDRDEPRLDFKESLLEELSKRSQQKKSRVAVVYFRRLAIAASLCLLIVCAFLISNDDSLAPKEMASHVPLPVQKDLPIVEKNTIQEESARNLQNQLPESNPEVYKRNQQRSFKSDKLTYVKKERDGMPADKGNESIAIVQPEVNNQPTAHEPALVSEPALALEEKVSIENAVEPTSSVAQTEDKMSPPIAAEAGTSLNSDKQENSVAAETTQAQDLGSYIKKGVWGFLKKKAKQITNNAIDIQSDESKSPTALALHFKSDLIEVQKTIPLNREND